MDIACEHGRYIKGYCADCYVKELEAENARLREALIDIAKVNHAGPSTDERREWTWATAQLALDETASQKTPSERSEEG